MGVQYKLFEEQETGEKLCLLALMFWMLQFKSDEGVWGGLGSAGAAVIIDELIDRLSTIQILFFERFLEDCC